MTTIEIQFSVICLTDKGRTVVLPLERELEVEGHSWREDMHPDGIGYYQTFFEPADSSVKEAVEDWLDKQSVEDIDFLCYEAELLEENEKVVKIVDYEV